MRVLSAFVLLMAVTTSAAPTLAEPIRITGRVVLPSGAQDAQVELHHREPSYEEKVRAAQGAPSPVATARPAADGAFALLAPEPGAYQVLVKAEGFLPAALVLESLQKTTELAPATLVRASIAAVKVPGPGTRLLVLGLGGGDDGSPPWYPAPREVAAGEDGIARLPYGRGERLGVFLLQPQALTVFPEIHPEEIQELRPSRTPLTVEVRGLDDRPLPGAFVGLDVLPLTTTGRDGRFTVDIPGPGMLTVLGPGGQWAEVGLDPASAAPGEVRIARLQSRQVASGRVLDAATGRPLPGARVRHSDTSASTDAVADAEGNFRIELPPRSHGLSLTASAEGYVDVDWFPRGQGTDLTGPISFALRKAAGLTGTVVDAEGRPVRAVRIRAVPARISAAVPLSEEQSTTEADGTFDMPGLRAGGRYALTVDGGSFAPLSRLVDVPAAGQAGEPLRLVVAPGATAAGKVVDERGRPVAGATVHLSPPLDYDSEAPFPDSGPATALSGADGGFSIPHLAAGRYGLVAEREGFAPKQIARVEIPAGDGAVDLGEVRLAASLTLEGRVVDEDGQPVKGAVVSHWMTLENAPIRSRAPQVRTARDGRFRMNGLSSGESYDLAVSAEGYVPAQAPGVVPPLAEPLQIRLQRGRTLTVRVVDPEQRPVAGALLSRVEETGVSVEGGGYGTRSIGSEGNTDDEGGLRIEALPPGVVDLLVQADDFQPKLVRGVRVPEDPRAGPVEIELARGGVLEGRVLDAEGNPLAGAQVSVSGRNSGIPGGGYRPPVTTDGEGRYRITGLVPDLYVVTVDSFEPQARIRTSAEVGTGVRRLDLDLSAGTPLEMAEGSGSGMVAMEDSEPLDPDRTGDLTLSGRVLLDGQPLIGARLEVSGRAAVTAYDGGFSVPRLRSGAQQLTLVVGPGTGHVRTFEMDRDEEIAISLSTGAIEGRILSPEGLPLAGVVVEIAGEQPEVQARFEGLRLSTDEHGAFESPRLVSGTYLLTVRGAGPAPVESRALIPPGGTVHLEILVPGRPER